MSELPHAILGTKEMAAADRFAIENGSSGSALMSAAGQGIVDAISKRWSRRRTAVLCGPGNNGGDGWEAAALLKSAGWHVDVFSMVEPSALTGDAARATNKWKGQAQPLSECRLCEYGLIIDALFGAGLTRPLDGDPARLAAASAGGPVIVSADVPSGLDGDRAQGFGPVFKADLTVTFHRLKPAHVLQPGAAFCGEVALFDIGIPSGWTTAAAVSATHNHPDLWDVPSLTLPPDVHKHARGRLCVRSGPQGATGASRLAAAAGLVGGAGFVTLLCPEGAISEIASSDRSLVTKAISTSQSFGDVLQACRSSALVLGPGAGLSDALHHAVHEALEHRAPLVLDADALTVFADDPTKLFDGLHANVVLTPHAGEFVRLFPDLMEDAGLNKIDQVRLASERACCVVVYKGADTVIGEPGGNVRVNTHASPRLATAGTGDLLAGLVGAFLAQGQDAFDAASAAVWIHGEAGRRSGPGATVETVLERLPNALADVRDLHARRAAMRRLVSSKA